jgi:hypothetical protein
MSSRRDASCPEFSALCVLRRVGFAKPDRRQDKVRRPGARTRSPCRLCNAIRISFSGLPASRRRNIGVANGLGFVVAHGPSPVAQATLDHRRSGAPLACHPCDPRVAPSSIGIRCAIRGDLSVRQRTWRVDAVFCSRRMQQLNALAYVTAHRARYFLSILEAWILSQFPQGRSPYRASTRVRVTVMFTKVGVYDSLADSDTRPGTNQVREIASEPSLENMGRPR